VKLVAKFRVGKLRAAGTRARLVILACILTLIFDQDVLYCCPKAGA
jgi:hypothetical protein